MIWPCSSRNPDEAAQAAFKAKSEALAPKYRTELLPHAQRVRGHLNRLLPDVIIVASCLNCYRTWQRLTSLIFQRRNKDYERFNEQTIER